MNTFTLKDISGGRCSIYKVGGFVVALAIAAALFFFN